MFFPLAVDTAADETDGVDDDWKALHRRLKALIKRGGINEAGREVAALAPNARLSSSYWWGLVKGKKANPGPEVRDAVRRWVEQQERIVEVVSGITSPVLDSEARQPETMTAPVRPSNHTLRSEASSVPTSAHAALYELLSMLPAPAILGMIPEIARQVSEYLATQAGTSQKPLPDPSKE